MKRHIHLFAALCLAFAAHAQDFPTREVKIVVPLAPGGGTDTITRQITEKLGRQLGKPVIIGRKTFQSIGGPLDGRDTIVVTRDPGFTADGVLVATSLEGAIALARACATARSSHELIIAGGGELYRLALPIADRIYLTRIHATPDGDATFPALDPNEWQEVTRAPLTTTPKDEFAAEVLVLQRHEKWA